MKTLSIQQPWASLVCAGIKDVENRTWKPAEVPGRILIHASSKKVTKNFFLLFYVAVGIILLTHHAKMFPIVFSPRSDIETIEVRCGNKNTIMINGVFITVRNVMPKKRISDQDLGF